MTENIPTANTVAAPAPGHTTSEYAITRFVMLASMVVIAMGAALASLPESVQGNKYVALALVIVGAMTKLLTALGYIRSRTDVKVATPVVVAVPGATLPIPSVPAPSPAPTAPADSPSEPSSTLQP